MKFSSFMSIFALLVVVPSIADAADAVTCGEVTCKSSGTWVYVGSGIEVQSLGYCITVNGGQYCAASAARCRAGYFAGLPVCESVTPKAGYAPRCPSSGGALCFGISCTKCSSYTGVSNATSDAGTAENSCGCYLAASSTLNEGTNGKFKYSSKCYYSDSADCATTRSALVKVYSPAQNRSCLEI